MIQSSCTSPDVLQLRSFCMLILSSMARLYSTCNCNERNRTHQIACAVCRATRTKDGRGAVEGRYHVDSLFVLVFVRQSDVRADMRAHVSSWVASTVLSVDYSHHKQSPRSIGRVSRVDSGMGVSNYRCSAFTGTTSHSMEVPCNVATTCTQL